MTGVRYRYPVPKGLVLLGRAPGRHPKYEPRYALFPVPRGCTGHRLMEMTGLGLGAYIGIERRNLLDYWPGAQGQGDAFPARAAREAAVAMGHLLSGKRVLMMGKAVAEAFGMDLEPLTWRWCELGGFDAAVVPHPSGRNRWYNEPGNREAATAFVRRAVQQVAGSR